MAKLFIFLLISCLSSYSIYNLPIVPAVKQEQVVVKKEKPMMHITIPAINISKDIYEKNSKENNIDKNVIIMNESDYPDEKGGIVILGAHSGPADISYFNDLYKLKKEDTIKLSYKNKTYTYKVVNYYLDDKNGSIAINNVNSKSRLFLYTCHPKNKSNYLVVVCDQM